VMDEPLPVHPLADPRVPQGVRGALLKDAGPDAAFDPGAAAALQDDGLDPGEVEEAREEEPGGPGSDDADLSAGGVGRHGTFDVAGLDKNRFAEPAQDDDRRSQRALRSTSVAPTSGSRRQRPSRSEMSCTSWPRRATRVSRPAP
jgi:hypothetical protein